MEHVQQVMLCYFGSTGVYFANAQGQNMNCLCGDIKDS